MEYVGVEKNEEQCQSIPNRNVKLMMINKCLMICSVVVQEIERTNSSTGMITVKEHFFFDKMKKTEHKYLSTRWKIVK